MPKNKSINLLPQEEFDTSILGRTLKWAMSTFRIIVIVTEMVVMGAFLSRFWLDAQNSDLTSAIKIKTAQISALSDTEKEFRSIQSKLNIAKQIQPPMLPSSKMSDITSKTPAGVTLNAMTIAESSAQVRGISSSEFEILQFVANLKASPAFKNVNLEQVNSAENNLAQITFSIKISY